MRDRILAVSLAGIRQVLYMILRFSLIAGSLLSLGLINLPTEAHLAVIFLTALALVLVIIFEKSGSKFRLWSIYIISFLLFVHLRSFADDLFFPVAFRYVIDIEKILCFGVIPAQWLQSQFYTGQMDFLVFFTTAVWGSYFFVPHISILVAWKLDEKNTTRNISAYIAAYYIGLLIYFIVPTAPPWVASKSAYISECHRILTDLGIWINYETYTYIYQFLGKPNDFAAMPSVHTAITCIVFLMAFESKFWLLKMSGVLYFFAMSLSLVFLGEHYVVDIVAGTVIGFIAWFMGKKIAGDHSGRRSLL